MFRSGFQIAYWTRHLWEIDNLPSAVLNHCRCTGETLELTAACVRCVKMAPLQNDVETLVTGPQLFIFDPRGFRGRYLVGNLCKVFSQRYRCLCFAVEVFWTSFAGWGEWWSNKILMRMRKHSAVFQKYLSTFWRNATAWRDVRQMWKCSGVSDLV